MQELCFDEVTKSRYNGAVCQCKSCGKYTKKVWEVTASKFYTHEDNTQYIHTEEYPLCYSCYQNITMGFFTPKPVEEMTDKEVRKMCKRILAANKEE